jgi:hypothetical protein
VWLVAAKPDDKVNQARNLEACSTIVGRGD